MRLTTALCVLGVACAVESVTLVSAQATSDAPAPVSESPPQDTPEQREYMRALLEAHAAPGSEASAPAAVQAPQEAPAPAEAPSPAAPEPEPAVPAPTPKSVAIAPTRASTISGRSDGESPESGTEEELGSRLVLRLTLGVSASLWIDGDEAELFRPASFSLMAGYAFDAHWALVARASSWLKTRDLANEYLGAGTLYRFGEAMSVAATAGVSITRVGTPSEWQHHIQGLALQADIGQGWTFGEAFEFVLGAHFQIGTPLGGKRPDNFTSVETGIFLGVGLL